MDLNRYKELLKEYISFQSVSTDEDKKDGIIKTANWLKELFEKNNFKTQFLTEGTLNPVVFASYEKDPKLKTVLVYGHYDVQPASKEDGWDSEPFELTEKDGRLYARGVVDNKGENLIHIFTVLSLIETGNLKYNVKFILEGNEETGGIEDMAILLEKNKELLRSDIVLVSDGELVSGKPAFEASLRGGCNLTIKYKVSNNNVHSGIYGGAVANAGYELSKLLAKIFDENNVVTIKDFYKDVEQISESELENNKRLTELDGGKVLAQAGFKTLRTENNQYDFYTQTGLRPTLQVTGIKCGYIGNGYSNIVPSTAEAKINFRIVASQKIDNVIAAFEEFVKKETPDFVEYEIEIDGKHEPVKLDINSEIFRETSKILEEAYDSEVFTYYVGGAIPFIGKIKDIFGIDTLSIGLCNEDCNMHGANENFRIDLVEKALKFSEKFFKS